MSQRSTQTPSGRLVYVGAELPKRSETFVYRELLGLRSRDWSIIPVSVRRSVTRFDEPELVELSREALVAYRPRALLAPFWILIYPAVFLRACADALSDRDLRLMQRFKLPIQASVALQIAWQLRDEGVAHVHAHMAHVPTNFAMYLALALKVPFSFTGHAADLFVDRQMLARKVGAAAFVVCISHWHREFYRSLNSGQIQFPVIRCGVDIEQFRPADRTGSDFPIKISAVGRLVAKKGFDILIDALAGIAGSSESGGGPVRVNLIGSGPEEDRLRMAVRRMELQDIVTFSGEQSNETVREVLEQSDIFVLPCKKADDGDMDGIPVALMEAMASGVCVISGRLPAIEELVEDEVSGLLVPPGDGRALSQAIMRLAGDADLRRRLAAAGRERVEQEFSSAVNLERLENCFRTTEALREDQ